MSRLVDECPECGYSLTGLPDQGVCPECGHDYDQSMLVLHGAARGRFAEFGNATTRGAIGRVAWVFCCLVMAGATVSWWWRRQPVMLLLLTAGSALGVLTVIRRLRSDRPGLANVYLRPDGFLQRDHDDRTLLYTLYRATSVVLAVVVFPLIVLAPDGAPAWVGTSGVAAAALIFCGAFAFHAVARHGRSRAEVFEHWRRSWHEVGRCQLEPAGNSHFRLRLRARKQDSRRELADLEFPCTTERAGRLDAMINAWIASAHRPASTATR
jgi:hypothetical protein